MALRDFDRVRERTHLRLELRHFVQAGAVATAIVGGAFYGGWHAAQTQPQAPMLPKVVVAKTIHTRALPMPHALNSHRSPILPTPVAGAARARVLAAREAVVLAPSLEEAAQHLGRAAVAGDRYAPRLELAAADSDTEHAPAVESPPQMLGALPKRPMARPRRTAKSVALGEAFAERRRGRTPGNHGEVPAEFVQSRAAIAGASSVDLSLSRSEKPASLGLWRGVDADGAAVQTPCDAGGFSQGLPTGWRSTAPIDQQARAKIVRQHREAELAHMRQREAKRQRAVAQAQQVAAERLRETERVRVAKASAEAARLKKQAEVAAEKAAAKQAAKAAKVAAKQAELAAKRVRIEAAKAKKRAELQAAQHKVALQQANRAKLAALKLERAKQMRAKQQHAKQVRLAQQKTTPKIDTRTFWVQIKSLKDGAEAKAFADGLRTKGYKLRVVAAQVPKMGLFHRVRLGPFRGQAAAKKAQSQFQKREGIETMVMSGPERR